MMINVVFADGFEMPVHVPLDSKLSEISKIVHPASDCDVVAMEILSVNP